MDGERASAWVFRRSVPLAGWRRREPGGPPRRISSEARAISNNGHVCGHYIVEVAPKVYRRRGFHWKNGVFTDLGLLPGYEGLFVTGINDRGEIIGWCIDSQNELFNRPFVWRDGVMTDLSQLVPLPPHTILSGAWDINNQGQIAAAGYSPPPNGTVEHYGFRLTPRSSVSGDYDCNHLVNVDDLLGVLNHWGPAPGSGPADLNRDGVVDPLDLLMVIRGWTFE